MKLPKTSLRTVPASHWLLVLCLVGLDYFSTLAYLPSLAVQAAGPLAPLGALVVVAVTLCIALPAYLFLVGRSPHGQGAVGIVERSVRGWRGKLLVLTALAFVATDFIVTQNLSTADAAAHLLANPWFNLQTDCFVAEALKPQLPVEGWCGWCVGLCDRQLAWTVVLALTASAFWIYWRKYSPRVFLYWAAFVVVIYLLLCAVVIGSGLWYLATSGQPLLRDWIASVQATAGPDAGLAASGRWWSLMALILAVFPHMALGLSGFELTMAVAPFVKGSPQDGDVPAGRIRNVRKLLVTAALIMAIFLPCAVLAATVLVPSSAYAVDGSAVHRSLAYLAHGGALADGQPGTILNPLFGPEFGMVFDLCSAWILCLAGASIAIALHDFIPEYLKRLGMEFEWAHKIGLQLRFFNVIVLIVAVLFRARIEALQWVYTTSVLVLLANGALAGTLEIWQRSPRSRMRPLAVALFLLALIFFLSMVGMTVFISRAGLEIAAAFVIGIFLTSSLSRWIRSTELRSEDFRFADEKTRQRWHELCALEFQVLVPHRPGGHSRVEKQAFMRRNHRIAEDVPMIFIEATLGDPSDFYQAPLLGIAREADVEVIYVKGCVSIAHAIAAIGLEMSRVGRPAEIHFGWSKERPLAANLNFLLFGEGNIPWMVHELILRACEDKNRQPLTVIG